jgi:hypothetical protein
MLAGRSRFPVHMSRRKRPHPWQNVVIAVGLAVAALIAVQTLIVVLQSRNNSIQAQKDAAANAKLRQ